MPIRFSLIDEHNRRDHYYLDEECVCVHLREYCAGKDYTFGATNNLISNFKKGMDRKGRPEWKYKLSAIRTFASEVASALNPEGLEGVVFVPAPPSKSKTHPEYDSRVLDVLTKAQLQVGESMAVCELVTQHGDRESAHTGGDRLNPAEHAATYQIHRELLGIEPQTIIVFDDVLTTGSTFMGMKQVLEEAYPGAAVQGMFLARCIREEIEW
ncbi:phosphoribosyltransferase [Parahaliea aestuarii]|uniref:Phosphoribosyltransferase n=1 Tax=Parahaliea aestuarii TaxID=1852021 RepID=A0A5C8ZK20_9GAMM|nr:phosphoribosyltransferase [Parahaliea aestuarii]TXS88956.1 phosphoribosyltransferase [Parahaliea aestuarii]